MRTPILSALLLAFSAITALRASAQPLTMSRTDHDSERGARAIAAGDFNRDGLVDVAHAGLDTFDVTILLNTREGGLIHSSTIGVGTGPFDMTSGDVNRDGYLDLVVACADSNTITILRGFADGNFSRARDIATGADRSPRGVVVADIDGDGVLDLVYTSYATGAVVALKGDGRGAFTAWRRMASPAAQPQGVAAGDFDRDGRVDLAVAHHASDGLVIWRQSPGGFTPAVVPGESALNVLAVADLDGNGWLDVAAASTDRGRVGVYRGGAAGLVHAGSYHVDADPRDIELADLNMDGARDVLTASRSSSTVNVLPGDPAHRGTFLSRDVFAAAAGSRAVAVGDFDADGVPDVAVGNQYAGAVSILTNTTPFDRTAYTFGRLALPAGADLSRYRAGLMSGRGFAVTDANRDGRLDFVQRVAGANSVAVVLREGPTVILNGPAPYAGHVVDDFDGNDAADVLYFASGGSNGGTSLLTFRGNGRGGFTRSNPTELAGVTLAACAAGDLNRDGRPDLACVEGGSVGENGGALYALLGRGDGTFRVPSAATGGYGMDPQVADINRDGRLDVVLGLTGEIWYGDGNGGLTQGPGVEVGFNAGWRAAVAELNRDGYPDLVFSYNGESLWATLGGPAGYREASYIYFSCECDFSFVVADIDLDGIADILVNSVEETELAGMMFVLRGRGDGTFGSDETPLWGADAFAFDSGEMVIADVTADGLPDALVPGPHAIHVLVNQRNSVNHPPVIAGDTIRRTVDYRVLRDEHDGCLTVPLTPPSDPDQHAPLVRWEVTADQFSSGYATPQDFLGASTAVRLCMDGPGIYTFEMHARDDRGAEVNATFAVVTVEGPKEIVLHMTDLWMEGEWQTVPDPAAAAGARVYYPNAGAPKVAVPRWPAPFVSREFVADPNLAYKLWVRLRADNNSAANDSVWVQFAWSADAAGNPAYRLDTPSGLAVNLEECINCKVAGWGWEDDGWGSRDRNGVLVRFPEGWRNQVIIQPREDGVSIDQIVLSAEQYLTQRPGAAKNDATIVPPTQ
jgi:hypothetical protein